MGDGSAVGLFGATGGYVSNIVLSAEVSEGLYVKRSRDLGANETVYMGSAAAATRSGWARTAR